MRVLHVLGELRPSGAETMLEIAAPYFADEGVSAEILSIGQARGSFAPRLEAAGYAIHHVPFAKSPAFFAGIFRCLRAGYDVVHLHVEQAVFWIALTAMAARTPTLLKSTHNCFAFEGNLRLRRKVQRHVLARLGVTQIAVSPSVRETERERYGIDTPVINNWFDADRYAPPDPARRAAARQAMGCAEGDLVLVSVANCNAFKNHGALVRAVALLAPQDRPLWLHLGAEEAGRPELELARGLGVAGRIRFMGSQDDVRPALHAADAFVMPSLREGLPISALEAMATGLPAILADAPGLRDLRPLFPGVLWSASTPEALAGALRAFAALEPAARRDLGREHPAIARREFGLRAGVDAYLRVYRGVA